MIIHYIIMGKVVHIYNIIMGYKLYFTPCNVLRTEVATP
jgi:hypothetical protein